MTEKNFLINFEFDIFNHEEKNILNKISHCNDKLNEKFSLVDDFEEIDFFQMPLVRNEKDYLLIDKNYCAWNFYEVIFKLLDYKFDKQIADNIENIIFDSFKKKGFKVYRGKYDFEDRECDIVVEEDESIIFIEVKKKALTNKANSGDTLKLAEDIVDSYIHSQEQLVAHEIIMKKNNKFVFYS